MTVSIRASLIFSALGMAALTAAFANPPLGKPAETAIARCDDCEPALPPTVSVVAPAIPETKQLPATLKDETCATADQPCAKDRETTAPEPRVDSAGPS
jgi:hypothetical protein